MPLSVKTIYVQVIWTNEIRGFKECWSIGNYCWLATVCGMGIVQCILIFCITSFGDCTHPQHKGTIESLSITFQGSCCLKPFNFHDLFKFSKTLGLIVISKKFQKFPCFTYFLTLNSSTLVTTKMRAVCAD